MTSENECFITGNLARDPEVKFTNTGRPMCKFTVAASHKSNGKEFTEWVPVQIWGPLAESCGDQLQKGSMVLVRGKFQTSKYKDGFGKDKYFTQIVAEQVALVLPGSPYGTAKGGGKQGTFNASQFGQPTPPPPQQTTFSDFQQGSTQQTVSSQDGVMGPPDEDIPF